MSATPIRIGIVGVGKIARDQHLPALAADERFALVAAASRNATVDGVENFPTLEKMLESGVALDAVSLCTPPQGRHRLAAQAIAASKHVMLEKPPGATVSEVVTLADHAREKGVTLFTSWHSREAAAVGPARDWLASRTIRSVKVDWKEDVRVWHPGQEWIWEPGGLGVFDPGINALSIVTKILPGAMTLEAAELSFPANRAAPIAADLRFQLDDGAPVHAEFDFRQTGPQSWDIRVETDEGTLVLTHGGSQMQIDGTAMIEDQDREYPNLYARFAELIAKGESEVDLRPLQHVADAFLLGARHEVEPFSY